ncbi:MAG: hypothetical protein AB8B72_06880 [Crocinitomicaceae bacterium]
MKKNDAIFLMVVIFFALQCNSEAKLKIDKANKIKMSPNEQQDSRIEVILFPEYVFTTKDTICKSWNYGGKSVFRILGNCKIKNIDFTALTEFRLIPVANGLRGKSIFYLISSHNDTLSFDAGMQEELPIDLYKNNFVFINNENQYLFGEIDQLDREIVCFNLPDDECFTR